ncbi:ribonuclease Y [Mycoplasmatota bacterium]|nr:ribonuclease Y [Mycoplasmatota bacterium]
MDYDIIFILLGLLFGSIIGIVTKSIIDARSINNAKKTSQKILDTAKREADKNRRESIIELKQEIHTLKVDADRDIKARFKVLTESENRLSKREERLDARVTNLDKRESMLNNKEHQIESKKSELDEKNSKMQAILLREEEKLVEISKMSTEQARVLIMNKVENKMSLEIAAYIKEAETEAKRTADKKSQTLLANAIMQYANDATSEKTVSVITLPNDEMKGRIIGREGRNIRTIESLTGVDLIIDDTPEAVVLSSFDPIRREIARKTLQTLVADGRIHPGRIEEIVEKSRKEVDSEIREAGEEAVFTTGIGKVHPDLIKLIGRLKFRTSYGQNVLKHSIETAFFTGKLAAELGENEILARRAGLLHDIGKAIDHEIEGSHIEIGTDLAKRYKEKPEVINSIASHHGDTEPTSVIAVLVAASDKLSAARPGARSESLENYLKRLQQLEEISNDFDGVEKSFAIQAGREIRVIVKPEKIDDLKTYKIARDIKEQIEEKMSYPGTIKVTVVRETRAVDIAK